MLYKISRLIFHCMFFISILMCAVAKGETLPVTMHMRSLAIQAESSTISIQSGVHFLHIAGLQKLLKQGIIVTFNYGIRIEQEQTFWKNQFLTSENRTIRLSFDPLTKNFTSRTKNRPLEKSKSLFTLLHKATQRLVFTLPLKNPLRLGKQYHVVAEVNLQKNDVPQWIQTSLFFWSWDIVPPIKLTQNFRF